MRKNTHECAWFLVGAGLLGGFWEGMKSCDGHEKVNSSDQCYLENTRG